MINVGDTMSSMEAFSIMGVILSTMGDILSTMGDVQYCGGYHDACRGIS